LDINNFGRDKKKRRALLSSFEFQKN